jgi:hypothetical protein
MKFLIAAHVLKLQILCYKNSPLFEAGYWDIVKNAGYLNADHKALALR